MNQAEVSIGVVGHVDHGKTTLVKLLTGTWADTHSEEMKRGITIRLGYADAEILQCPKWNYTVHELCNHCDAKEKCPHKPGRKIAFVDAPGHETLMTVMISGSALMDGAMLIISANEKCPQPQTYEHLMALEIAGVKKIVIVQNKVDLVSKEDAKKNYDDIKKFVKGTVAENAPVIPMAAHHPINVGELLEALEEIIPTPKRDPTKPARMVIARSFDVNKPGSKIEKLVGGTIGGSLTQGQLKIGDEIEICPGASRGEKHTPIVTKVTGLSACGKKLKEAVPGGLIGVSTNMDPSIAKSDKLVGNLAGKVGTLPEAKMQISADVKLMERVVGDKKVEPVKQGEMFVVNSTTCTSLGTVVGLKPVTMTLKRPICAEKGNLVAFSRRIENRWRLIGYGVLQ